MLVGLVLLLDLREVIRDEVATFTFYDIYDLNFDLLEKSEKEEELDASHGQRDVLGLVPLLSILSSFFQRTSANKQKLQDEAQNFATRLLSRVHHVRASIPFNQTPEQPSGRNP